MKRHPLLALIVLLGMSPLAIAQETPSEPTEGAPVEQPEAPKKVDVEPEARDEEIAARLDSILEATEWFADPQVEVKDGVVFLRGIAADEKYRAWATDLAQNTQDVAAVVNRMGLKTRSLWDMSPAIAELRSLAAATVQTTPIIIFGFIVIFLTWFLARGIQRLSEWFMRDRLSNPLLRGVVSKASMIPVLLLGVYIVLRVSGLTQLALTVLGGTGIAGLIIGIAFRDIAENFLASILISMQNPFRIGDFIAVNEYRGLVQRVSARGTLLMTLDGNHVQIPNAIIYKSTVTNFTANPNRRIQFVLGIGYDDSISKAQQVIKRELDKHPNVLNDPEPRVIVDELGASTVNLLVYAWLDASQHSPDAVRSSSMRLIKQALLNEGISMPDESREIIFPNQVPVRMISDDPEAAKMPPDSRNGEKQPAKSQESEEVHSVGEGSQRNDEDELQRQADKSWLPDDGTNLLSENSEHDERETVPS